MIALFDYDFVTATKVTYPSLLLTKMATYLAEQGEDYIMIQEVVPNNRYEKVLFFSNKAPEDIPIEYLLIENLELLGNCSKEEPPELVHYCIPDISVYNGLIREKLVDGTVTTKKALDFLDSIYYLAKHNGKTLPLPPMGKQKKLFLFDKDILGYEDCWSIFDKIMARSPTSIYTVNPILCHSMKQFLYLREEYEKVSRQNEVMLDFFVPTEDFDVYFGKYKLKLLGEITKTSEVGIYLGKNYKNDFYSNDFYVRNLLYCMNLVFSYYSRNIPIQAKIWEPIGVNNPYYDFYRYLRAWTNNKNYDITLRESFSRSKKAQERTENFLELHPIFNEFFNKSKNDLITTRGIWRVI